MSQRRKPAKRSGRRSKRDWYDYIDLANKVAATAVTVLALALAYWRH
jgi:hypothetical protein